MIIELYMVQDDGAEIVQTYAFGDKSGLSNISIPSYKYSHQAMRLLRFASYILNVSLPNQIISVVSDDEFTNYFKPINSSSIAITHDNTRIELGYHNDLILVTINHNDKFYCDLSGMITLNSIQFSLYWVLYMKGAIELVNEFNTVVYYDGLYNAENDVNTIHATPDADVRMKKYVKECYNIDIDKVVHKFGVSEVLYMILEGFMATSNMIIFSDLYESIDAMIEKEEIPKDELIRCDNEYNRFIDDIVNIMDGIKDNLGIRPYIIMVNANPANDKYYAKCDESDEDNGFDGDHDLSILSELGNSINKIFNQLMPNKSNDDDDDDQICIFRNKDCNVYGGYIDDDGNTHIFRRNDDGEVEDIIVD